MSLGCTRTHPGPDREGGGARPGLRRPGGGHARLRGRLSGRLEVDEVRARRLAAGDSFIEDVPDDVLRGALDRGYVATADVDQLSGCDVAVISVPTPLHDGPDLPYIESAARMIGPHVRSGCLVVPESTT